MILFCSTTQALCLSLIADLKGGCAEASGLKMHRCVPQAERLARALRRERLRFMQSYNDRLFGGLVVASLAAIVVFRFVLRVAALETAAWVAFAFLQVGWISQGRVE